MKVNIRKTDNGMFVVSTFPGDEYDLDRKEYAFTNIAQVVKALKQMYAPVENEENQDNE